MEVITLSEKPEIPWLNSQNIQYPAWKFNTDDQERLNALKK